MRKWSKELHHSLTWDRGSEMAGHKTFTSATKIDVYLCNALSLISSLQAAIAEKCMAAQYKQKIPTASKADHGKGEDSVGNIIDRGELCVNVDSYGMRDAMDTSAQEAREKMME